MNEVVLGGSCGLYLDSVDFSCGGAIFADLPVPEAVILHGNNLAEGLGLGLTVRQCGGVGVNSASQCAYMHVPRLVLFIHISQPRVPNHPPNRRGGSRNPDALLQIQPLTVPLKGSLGHLPERRSEFPPCGGQCVRGGG